MVEEEVRLEVDEAMRGMIANIKVGGWVGGVVVGVVCVFLCVGDAWRGGERLHKVGSGACAGWTDGWSGGAQASAGP